MMLKEKDLVFAKLRGFPYWPGIIIEIKSKKIIVQFFGYDNK